MPNTLHFELMQPTTDRWYDRAARDEAAVLIPATSTATAAPDGDTGYVSTGEAESIRAFVKLAGTVNELELALWLLQDGDWYEGAVETIDPARGNQSRDFGIFGKFTRFTLQISAISGGGTAEVRVLGIW